LITLSDALTAYRICARAEGKSRRTIEWITSSVRYFSDFLGGDQDLSAITANDLRRFIIALQGAEKYRNHPYNRPQQARLSPQSIETYCRAIRAFFGYLKREELIEDNPMERVRMPKVPKKVVPTFSQKEVEKLLSQPDKRSNEGFRHHVIMLVLLDTAARVSFPSSLLKP